MLLDSINMKFKQFGWEVYIQFDWGVCCWYIGDDCETYIAWGQCGIGLESDQKSTLEH